MPYGIFLQLYHGHYQGIAARAIGDVVLRRGIARFRLGLLDTHLFHIESLVTIFYVRDYGDLYLGYIKCL